MEYNFFISIKEVESKMGKIKLTGQPNVMKEVNRSLIKEALIKAETATRVELSQMTKVSQPTVNAIIKQMLESSEVKELGYGLSSGGRKAMRYGFNHEITCIAAVILSSVKMQYEIADLSGKSMERAVIAINQGKSYVQNLNELVKRLLKKNQYIKGLTIGVPAAVSGTGEVFAIPQIPELEGCNLKEMLERDFHIHVKVVNDINTTAYGYYCIGIDTKMDDMVFIHAGAGLGASMIINGRVLNGFSSFAGEIGYMQINSGQEVQRTFEVSSLQEKTGIISRIVVNIICLVNPPLIVLGGTDISTEMVEKIKTYCIDSIPSGMIPNLMVLEDEEKYYLEGAVQTAVSSVGEGIRLVVG